MIFNTHSSLKGYHSVLSPSKYHWINYTDDKFIASYYKYMASIRGTELHEFAKQAIRLKIKLPKSHKTLNMYVNDAIGFDMNVEQTLYFSENCFGTSDAISFRKNILRIHDLKTGVSPTSMKQLEIYASIFCLEYNYKPSEIDMELRIYQSDECLVHNPIPDNIYFIMDKIKHFDKTINELK